MDFSPLQLRRYLLKGEIPLPHEREEFLDWGNCDILWHSRKFKGLECFTTSIPESSINHASLWHAECFNKVRLNVLSDNSFYDQPVSLTKEALNPTVKVCEGNPEKLSLTGVAVDSRNAGYLQGICDQTTIENMETEEVADHGEIEIMTNCQGQGNNNQSKTAQVTDEKQVLNVTKKDYIYPLMESNADENMKEFNYGQQENEPLGESSGQLHIHTTSLSGHEEKVLLCCFL